MNDKYQQLGNLLKAYTQNATDITQSPLLESAPKLSTERAQRAFGTYLSAAIDSSSMTRAQVAQTTGISEVTLYGLERGLIPVAEVNVYLLRRLATTLDEDMATFNLLLGSAPQRLTEETVNSDVEERSAVQSRDPILTGQPPIPISKEPQSEAERPKRLFGMPIGRLPTFVMGGAVAAIILVLLLNPQFINRLIGLDTGLNTGGSPAAEVVSGVQIATASPESVGLLAQNMAGQLENSSVNSGAGLLSASIGVNDSRNGYSASADALAGSEQLSVAEAQSIAPVEVANNSGANLAIVQAVAVTPAPTRLVAQNSNNAEQSNSADSSAATSMPITIDSDNAYPAPAIVATSQPAPTPPAYPAPLAMTFIDYGINAFTNTATDNLSTFSVDVDTGSYTIARRYIESGQLPPQEAIRVEEFVNYFDYGYEQPAEDEVFAIHADIYPSPFTEQHIDAEEPGDVHLMRIGIQGYELPENQRPDVALTFVVDVSGSMRDGGRLTLVKRALTMLVEQLRPSDTIGIVVYSTDARVLLQPTRAINANLILNAIFQLQPEDSTNVAAGLNLGYDMAWRNFNEQAINRVILASDGVANVDATDPNQIWQQAEQYAERGITLTSIGVGMGNYNDVIMEQLANMGDGVYGYVDSIEEAERLFVDELTGTLVTIAKDAKVQVDFNPETVRRYRLLGYENRDVADIDFRNDTVDAGEIGAGHSVTALYEVELVPEVRGNLATIQLRWQDVDSDEVIEIERAATLNENSTSFEDAPSNFQLAAVVAEFAESLRNSLYVDSQLQEQEVSPELRLWAYKVGGAMKYDENVSELADLIMWSNGLASP